MAFQGGTFKRNSSTKERGKFGGNIYGYLRLQMLKFIIHFKAEEEKLRNKQVQQAERAKAKKAAKKAEIAENIAAAKAAATAAARAATVVDKKPKKGSKK